MRKHTNERSKKKFSLVKKRKGILNEIPFLQAVKTSKNGDSPKSIRQNLSDVTKTILSRQENLKK